MSLLYRLKPEKDRILAPVTRPLSSAGVTPNMVTAAGLLVSAAAGLIAASGQLPAAVVVFLLGACFDALDGSLARTSARISVFGLYLDSVCDRLSEAVFVAGAVVGGVHPLALAVVAGSVLLLAARVRNHRMGLRSDAAVIGRPERLALLIAGMLSSFPASVLLFTADALLCVLSSWRVLASGAGSPRGHCARGGSSDRSGGGVFIRSPSARTGIRARGAAGRRGSSGPRGGSRPPPP